MKDRRKKLEASSEKKVGRRNWGGFSLHIKIVGWQERALSPGF